ncbi:hypothetical protein ACG83_36835 [Frankia sp. R43]|uniref:glycosyltransferase family 2 protein n=1 Tax=Frankia sp. R43 TaxID=269536 RepID=UPI0006DB5BE2|nr:glycosyltransferase [Frankia sp. R43]KPM51018.1 hypothetical protein ACG83_36835 [Frankia sp. R43]
MPRPAVSVICPTYNRSSRILPTLRSVRAQTYPDWELLVVSDGSSDDTDEIVTGYAAVDPRVRLLRTSRQGHPAPVREIGLTQARGDVIAYLDHDDTWLPDHLAVLVDALHHGSSGTGSGARAGAGAGAGADVAATGAVRVGPDGTRTSATGLLDLLWHPELQIVSPFFEPSRVAHRAGLTEAVGGWRQLDCGLEDWDLWLRLADTGARFATVDARTVVLEDGGPSRRTRVPRRHHHPLGHFPDLRSAARAVAALRAAGSAAAMRDSARADQIAWYRDLAATGELRWPLQAGRGRAGPGRAERGQAGEPVSPAAVTELVEQALGPVDQTAPPWPDLVVSRQPADQGGGAVIGLPLWCGTPEHAERVREVLRHRQERQLGLASRLLRAAGNTTAGKSGLLTSSDKNRR